MLMVLINVILIVILIVAGGSGLFWLYDIVGKCTVDDVEEKVEQATHFVTEVLPERAFDAASKIVAMFTPEPEPAAIVLFTPEPEPAAIVLPVKVTRERKKKPKMPKITPNPTTRLPINTVPMKPCYPTTPILRAMPTNTSMIPPSEPCAYALEQWEYSDAYMLLAKQMTMQTGYRFIERIWLLEAVAKRQSMPLSDLTKMREHVAGWMTYALQYNEQARQEREMSAKRKAALAQMIEQIRASELAPHVRQQRLRRLKTMICKHGEMTREEERIARKQRIRDIATYRYFVDLGFDNVWPMPR